MENQIKLKILVIGESGVGKSSLMLRFSDPEAPFNYHEQPTIGVDFKVKQIEIEGQKIYLQIWDTAGQERFRTLIPSYYREASGAILVYDVTKASSFQKLDTWLEELESNTNRDCVKMIVGNKIDLKNRAVDREMALRFAKKCRALYIETSCAENINVQKSFEEVVRKVLEEFPDQLKGSGRNDIRLIGKNNTLSSQTSSTSCGYICR